jgi:hypothetical protein
MITIWVNPLSQMIVRQLIKILDPSHHCCQFPKPLTITFIISKRTEEKISGEISRKIETLKTLKSGALLTCNQESVYNVSIKLFFMKVNIFLCLSAILWLKSRKWLSEKIKLYKCDQRNVKQKIGNYQFLCGPHKEKFANHWIREHFES